MSVQDSLRVVAQDPLPIIPQWAGFGIGVQKINRFQVPCDAIAAVQHQGNAIRAMAWCGDNLPAYANIPQKRPAVHAADYRRLRLIDRLEGQSVTCENVIGEMDGVFLGIDQQQFYALFHQIWDQAHVIRVVMRCEYISNIRHPDPDLFDGAVKGWQRPCIVSVDEEVTTGAGNQEGVCVAVSQSDDTGNH